MRQRRALRHTKLGQPDEQEDPAQHEPGDQRQIWAGEEAPDAGHLYFNAWSSAVLIAAYVTG